MDVCDRVLSVHGQGIGGRATQGGVQDGSILRDVDVFTREHAVTQIEDAGLLSEREEVSHQRGAHEVLRQVNVQVGRIEGECLRARGVVRE